jgi:hypothetical protein
MSVRRMQRMSQAEFEALTRDATTLSADEHGSKVLRTPDGRVIKLFRRKRVISSNLFWPYAKRFERASRELAARGFAAPAVERIARVPSIGRDLVVYGHMPGVTLREALAGAVDRTPLMLALAQLLAKLHERGVYFRAAHFGNVLVQRSNTENAQLALIDLSEAQFRRGPLSASQRARNFRPLTRYHEDLAAVQAFGVERLIMAYLDAARLTPEESRRFRVALSAIDCALATRAPGVA